MATKPRTRTQLLLSATLLTILALLGCVSAALAAMDPNVQITNSTSSQRVLGAIRITRRLKTARMVDADDDSEGRAIDATIPGVARAVEALKSKSQLADDLLSKMKASTPALSLFESAQFRTWSSHISAIHPEKVDEAIVSKLATQYGDEALTVMLGEANQSDKTKAIATRLEEARLKNWLGDGKTADDAFVSLHLLIGKYMLLFKPETRLWVSYVSKLHPQEADDVILSVLKTHFKTDEQLGQLLSVQYGLADNAVMAARLKGIVLKYWLGKQKSADDVFGFMLNSHKALVFRTSVLDDWVSYVKMVDTEMPFQTMFAVLHNRFKDDLPRMLEQASKVARTKQLAEKLELESWLNSRWSATTVFDRLELGSAGSRLFQMPAFNTWVSYTQRLEGPNAVKVMLKTLTEQYSTLKLYRMLAAAKKVESTKKIATELQKKLWASFLPGFAATAA